MKTMKWKFYSLAFVAGMSILTACSSDDNNDNDGNGGNGKIGRASCRERVSSSV